MGKQDKPAEESALTVAQRLDAIEKALSTSQAFIDAIEKALSTSQAFIDGLEARFMALETWKAGGRPQTGTPMVGLRLVCREGHGVQPGSDCQECARLAKRNPNPPQGNDAA